MNEITEKDLFNAIRKQYEFLQIIAPEIMPPYTQPKALTDLLSAKIEIDHNARIKEIKGLQNQKNSLKSQIKKLQKQSLFLMQQNMKLKLKYIQVSCE